MAKRSVLRQVPVGAKIKKKKVFKAVFGPKDDDGVAENLPVVEVIVEEVEENTPKVVKSPSTKSKKPRLSSADVLKATPGKIESIPASDPKPAVKPKSRRGRKRKTVKSSKEG